MDKMLLQALIIDDEAAARGTLKSLLKDYCPEVEVIGEANGVEEGLKLLHQLKPQLVFLDIDMKDGTGFDLLDRLEAPDFQLIFSTAFHNFALKAFQYNAISYLLKPVDADELVQAIRKVRAGYDTQQLSRQLALLRESLRQQRFDKLVLPSAEGLSVVPLADIIRLEADGNYSLLFLKGNEKLIVTKTLKEFEELLPTASFFRSHQSHMVNINHVKKYLREDGGYVLMDDGSKVLISRRKKEDFLNFLKMNFD